MKIPPLTLAVLLLALAILVHALLPRYAYQDAHGLPIVRVDRWTGALAVGRLSAQGAWIPRAEPAEQAAR